MQKIFWMKDYILRFKKAVYKTVCDIAPLDVKNILKTVCMCEHEKVWTDTLKGLEYLVISEFSSFFLTYNLYFSPQHMYCFYEKYF